MKSIINTVKQWMKNKEYVKLSILVLVILVALEVTVFNARFYSNIGNEPIQAQFTLLGDIRHLDEDLYSFGAGEKTINIMGIDKKVKNIYIDAQIYSPSIRAKENKVIKTVISATDDGNSEYFDLPERNIIYNMDRSKYMFLNCNGDTERLKITFKDCDYKTVELKDIIINANVPFSFNVVRVLLGYLLIALIYIIRPKSGFYKYKFNFASTKQKTVLTAIIAINVAVILALGFAHPDRGINAVSHHNQYNWLADAIVDGHFYLNDEPPEFLQRMDNPYDYHSRKSLSDATGQTYKWDTAYYNGKYYVYFGIVPELLFFLPAKLMNVLIINKAPVMVMTMLAVIFGYLLMREIARRWFKDTSFLVFLLISTLFVNSMGIYLAIRIPDLYMLPISHALAFSIIGLYCWIYSLPESNSEKTTSLKGSYLCVGSICMALVAGCRPQVVLASFLALPLFWKAVFKDRELFSAKTIGKTIAFVMPYVVVATFLMFYNYARFGNVFDFGANYNLTVMDMVSEKFNLAKIPLGIYTYFLQLPKTIATFPYIRNVDISRNFMGNYVMEAQFGGMLACNIILFSLLFIGKVKDKLKQNRLYAFTMLNVVFGFVIAVVDCNTGGLVLRYMVDFSWLILIGCAIVVMAISEKYRDFKYVNYIYSFVAVGFVWSMAYNFMLLFNVNAASYKDNIPELWFFFERMIEFWV